MSGNSTDSGGGSPPLLNGLEDSSAVVYGIVLAMMLFALFGKFHTRVIWVRRYFWAAVVLCAFRVVKLSVPQFAFYQPFTGQATPVLGSSGWWWMMGEWLFYIIGNSADVISYAIILRLWHYALETVVGVTPSWPQVALLYLITLTMATDLVLTVLLVFMPPDTINVVEAIKSMAEAMCIACAFSVYWWLLRRALKQFAALTKGRTIMVSGQEIALGDKALRKLKRIMWVSAACTLGSAYRAGSLVNFVLYVMHLVSESYNPTAVMVERFIFYVATETLPPITMFIVMMKCNRPPPGTAAARHAAGGDTRRGGGRAARAAQMRQPAGVPVVGAGYPPGAGAAGGFVGAGGGRQQPYRYMPVPDNGRYIVN